MQKRTLRWILIIIVVAISLYQFFNDADPRAPEPSTQPTATNTALGIPAEVFETAEVQIEPTVLLTETPAQRVSLEEATGNFDFYVMALSWSPDYCASTDYQDEQQCSIGKELDFVLHGLWPQYEQGWPSYCSTEELPYDLKDEYASLYPSEKLFDHEWEKHGTCAGLSPEGYLLWSQELKENLEIPAAFDSPTEPFRTDAAELADAFIAINPEFSEDSFAVYCSGSGRFMKELFVCFEKDGEPRSCSDEILKKASKSCGQDDFLVRNTR